MSSRPSLAGSFFATRRDEEPSNAPDVERHLAAALSRGREAWPDLEVDPEAFIAYLSERVPADASIPDELEQLQLSDLYIAFACSRGDARALAAFDAYVLHHVPRFIARIGKSHELVDIVRQRLRESLFVLGERPKIFEYGGRGPLGAWVRVAAIRLAMNEQRDEGRAAMRGRGELSIGDTGDPELQVLKSRYAPEVQQAFEATLRSLTTDQRNVLRMHYIDGLTMDEIGTAYDVSRSTAARWIAEARQMIVDDTRRRLREGLRGTASEIESILRLVQSQLELSIRILLPKDG